MTYNELLQKWADEYLALNNVSSATTKDFAVWAIREKDWEPPSDLLVRH